MMTEAQNYRVAKGPFFLAGALLMVFAYFFIWKAPNTAGHWEIAAACVVMGALLGVLPFYLDYCAMGKLIEINALGTVAEKIQKLEQLAGQISAATNQWAAVQESVGGHAGKTADAARQIADKMSAEVREFSEFMNKMNDSEKTALRLEVEKLRRGEGEWLQMLVRILDHVFALHAAAHRSSHPKVAEQITQFQNVCLSTVRRVGLATFAARPQDPFDASRYQIEDGQKPAEGAVIAETIAAGYTFQGKLLRPALVRLRDPDAPAAETRETNKPLDAAQDTLALDAD